MVEVGDHPNEKEHDDKKTQTQKPKAAPEANSKEASEPAEKKSGTASHGNKEKERKHKSKADGEANEKKDSELAEEKLDTASQDSKKKERKEKEKPPAKVSDNSNGGGHHQSNPSDVPKVSDNSNGGGHHQGNPSDEPKGKSEGSLKTGRRLRSNNSVALPAPAAQRGLAIFIPFRQHIPICHRNGSQVKKLFHGPTPLNRYCSMTWLSALTTGGTKNVGSLAKSRQRSYWGLFVGLIVTMFMKYSLKLVDIGTGLCGHKYVQLWNGGRTTIDRMIESLIIHGVSIVFTLSMQLTLCTCFLTFWQGEYFVMSYVPGVSFVAFFGSFVVFTIGMVCDRVKQIMLNSSNCYIICFWICWVMWMLWITVPMLGYCMYVLQYAYEVQRGHWIEKEPFSEEFVKASETVIKAVGGFTGIAVIELYTILKLDLEEGKSSRGA